MTALRTDVNRDGDTERRASQRPNRGRQVAVLALLTGLLLAGAGIAVAVWPKAASTFAAAGTVTLGKDAKGDPKSIGKPCMASPASGYGDIRKGAQVVVTDSGGKTVAVGTLAGGIERGGAKVGYSCVFSFEVRGVPAGDGFYGVSVGSRKPAQYAENVIRGQHVNLVYPG
jgi:hypothetical protein